jgi:hypothetical protein
MWSLGVMTLSNNHYPDGPVFAGLDILTILLLKQFWKLGAEGRTGSVDVYG